MILRVLKNILPTQVAEAHCDVPCGIYDPKPAQIYAQAVLKMVQLIITPTVTMDQNDINSVRNYHNAMTRYVMTKEDQAEKCKKELLILWTDYFKPEHLEMFPDLHDKFWQAAKLCSKNKQSVSLEDAQKLVAAVDEIADMFAKSKAAHTH